MSSHRATMYVYQDGADFYGETYEALNSLLVSAPIRVAGGDHAAAAAARTWFLAWCAERNDSKTIFLA